MSLRADAPPLTGRNWVCYPAREPGRPMRSLTFTTLALTAAITLSPRTAEAWGDVGHEVICQIAFEELTPLAKANVRWLMQFDEDFRSFARSCTWPDDSPRQRAPEHFVNLSRGSPAFGDKPCPEADRCVVSAILNDVRDLALLDDPTERVRLLKSLGHWIGDLHQPMHVSFEDDRGGNSIAVGAPCGGDLHAAWDYCIIEEAIGDDASKIAVDLRAEITPADRAEWTPATIDADAVLSWAGETFAISIDPATRYCVMVGNECWYDIDRRLFTGGEPKMVIADEAYLKAQAAVVRQRLKQAGVRLAAVLDSVFADVDAESATPEARAIALRIAAIEAQIRMLTVELKLLRSVGP